MAKAKKAPALVCVEQADGSIAITWPGWTVPAGGAILRVNGAADKMISAGATSYVDIHAVAATDAYALSKLGDTITGSVLVTPPSLGFILGAYDDGNPSGTDDSVNVASLQAGLQALAPPGKIVAPIAMINTYTGLPVAVGWKPLNGVTPKAGTKILLSFALGDGTPYSATGTTLLAQCQALAPAYTSIMEEAVTLVGLGNTIGRIGTEANGDWTGGTYPVGGTSPACEYPQEDYQNAVRFVAGVLRAVDAKLLVDFNYNGDGPDNLLDQLQLPTIGRCPLDITDVISVDTAIKAYGVSHAAAVANLAATLGKAWAVDEMAGVYNEGAPLDGDIDNMVLFCQGKPALDRGNNVTVQAKTAASWMCLFDTDDSNAADNLLDTDNEAAASAWAGVLST
jgi:hypothetical protein